MHAVEYYISYTQVGLVRYKVDRVEAMADLETEYRPRRAVQLEQQRLLRVFKDPHKRRANARVRRAKKLKVDKKAVGYDSSESEQEGDTSQSEQGDAESPDGHSTIIDGQGESSQEDAALLAAPESEDEGAKEGVFSEIGKYGSQPYCREHAQRSVLCILLPTRLHFDEEDSSLPEYCANSPVVSRW